MSIDEHYSFISSVGFQQKLIVKFLLLKEWKTKRCCEVSRFILMNFRTKSPKYDTNQFLPLNSLWSWVYVRCFLTKHHCDKYGNGHYDSNNSYQTFSTASFETIDSCRHMSAFGLWWLFLRTFMFWMNMIHNDYLLLFRRHILSSAMNVGFTSFLS